MTESAIERAFISTIRRHGGLAPKFIPTVAAGFPDRIALLPGGRCFFAEIKAPGEKPRRIQELWHQRLRALGFTVEVIDSPDAITAAITTALNNAIPV